jgi:hypothetical protein
VVFLDATFISPSAGLIVGTIVSVALFALVGWVALVVVPRHLSTLARRGRAGPGGRS